MSEAGEEKLRRLIRLIPPARALRENLEKSLHMELYGGTGDMAVRSFQGLWESTAAITDDPYVSALSLEVPDGATDKEKVSLVLLAAGQLLAYLEGQTGLVGMGGGNYSFNVQTAPTLQNVMSWVDNVPPGQAEKMANMIEKAMGANSEEDQPDEQ